MDTEREKPTTDTYDYGAVVKKRQSESSLGFPEAPRPDVFGRTTATPRQIEEIILLTKGNK